MKTYGALIDGEMLAPESVSGVRSKVTAPWDGAVCGEVALATPTVVERALAGAVAAFEATKTEPYPLHERIAVLERVARRLSEANEDLAATLSAEAGKPIALARTEVERAVATFEEAAVAARTALGGEILPLSASAAAADRVGISRRFPRGVVSAITPFNFPVNLVAHKVAPAIAAGCPLVLKPAPQAPLSAFALGEICLEAGLRPGFLQIVYCDHLVATPLVEDPRIALLSFTGSARVGWALKARAGRKRVVLELGGNGAVIVQDCADVEAVGHRIAVASNAYAGQTCISVQRILVRRELQQDLRAALVDAMRALPAGDPALPKTLVGPVIDDAAASRIETWVKSAVAGGARSLGALRRHGRLLHPVLLEGVPHDHPVSCEEVFGPVATLEAYDDFEEALDRVNSSAYGLQAGVYVRDVGLLFRAYERLDVGGVVHDDCPSFRVDAMPYGGNKDSGEGREGPRYAIEDMTEERILVIRLSSP